MSDFENRVSGALERIEAKVEALGGTYGRVTLIEKQIEEHESRQWWHTMAVVPLTAILNVLIRKLSNGGGH